MHKIMGMLCCLWTMSRNHNVDLDLKLPPHEETICDKYGQRSPIYLNCSPHVYLTLNPHPTPANFLGTSDLATWNHPHPHYLLGSGILMEKHFVEVSASFCHFILIVNIAKTVVIHIAYTDRKVWWDQLFYVCLFCIIVLFGLCSMLCSILM